MPYRILLFIILLLLPAAALRAVELTLPDPLSEEISEGRLATWDENVVETGVSRDAIPSLIQPHFLNTEDASLVMDDRDHVFVADYAATDVRIYPQNIMAWHQAVNDVTDAGEAVAVTYCPLSGSLVGYKCNLGNRILNFGVTGNLVNNNTILYDRNTASRWPQITGIAFSGPLKGKRLERFPLLWTTWERARKAFPEARVLSRATGYDRAYDRDPYGNYHDQGSYYYDDMIVYHLTNWDKRLPPKERIHALRSETGQTYAVRKDVARQKGVLQFWANMTPLAAIYDPELDLVRVFDSSVGEQALELELVGGEIRDKQSRSTWDSQGRCVSGAFWGEKLSQITGFDVFWFALAAFYPSVEVVPPLDGETWGRP